MCDLFLPPLATVCGLPKFSRKQISRIFNGRPAQKGTTPWIAMLSQLNGQPFCGGSLLGKEKVKGAKDSGLGTGWKLRTNLPLKTDQFFIENHCLTSVDKGGSSQTGQVCSCSNFLTCGALPGSGQSPDRLLKLGCKGRHNCDTELEYARAAGSGGTRTCHSPPTSNHHHQ